MFEEPATLPETPPSAAGRKSGVEQKAGREGARHEDQLTFRAHAFAVFFGGRLFCFFPNTSDLRSNLFGK